MAGESYGADVICSELDRAMAGVFYPPIGGTSRYAPFRRPRSVVGRKRSWCLVGSNVRFARKQTSRLSQGAISVIALVRVTGITENLVLQCSLALDACRLENRPPFLDFGFVVGSKRLRGLLCTQRNRLTQIR